MLNLLFQEQENCIHLWNSGIAGEIKPTTTDSAFLFKTALRDFAVIWALNHLKRKRKLFQIQETMNKKYSGILSTGFKLEAWKSGGSNRFERCKQLSLMCMAGIFPLPMQIRHTCVYTPSLFLLKLRFVVTSFGYPKVLPKTFSQTTVIWSGICILWGKVWILSYWSLQKFWNQWYCYWWWYGNTALTKNYPRAEERLFYGFGFVIRVCSLHNQETNMLRCD